jgi:P4 family phage/plasmid primase-like protien
MFPVDARVSTNQNISQFYTNYKQLVNNGTINNNNITININNGDNGEPELEIQIDDEIFNDAVLTKLVNECLDGHKITKISELTKRTYVDYVYDADWYMFTGSMWSTDNKNLGMKRDLLDLMKIFNKVACFYTNKTTTDGSVKIIKNIKSLSNKLAKPSFKDDIIKEAMIYYYDKGFTRKLNSKKFLLPFTNGVYDMINNNFRTTIKEDYVNLTVAYPYDPDVNNQEVHTFLHQVMPNLSVRNYVLKKMSECLNGDIPNTNFLMFIGDGANGKSQLLNLMQHTLGEFGEKVEVTLLTRKRNNANEANTEKIKLMDKRFAFVSEPEDGEKMNIGLLKELTGSEEVVARGLYQDSVSFVMHAKLFLACNELPDIKGEDTALWRRIRVVDFPSRFVEHPQNDNEYKIDKTLPSRMREDYSWRQTFMNILLQYYFKDVEEPEEVQIKTNEYREDNNEYEAWFKDTLEYNKGSCLKASELTSLFLQGKGKVSNQMKSKFHKEVEKYIQKNFMDVDHRKKDTTINGLAFKGWLDIRIKE